MNPHAEAVGDLCASLLPGVRIYTRPDRSLVVADAGFDRVATFDPEQIELVRRIDGRPIRLVAQGVLERTGRVPFGSLRVVLQTLAERGLLADSGAFTARLGGVGRRVAVWLRGLARVPVIHLQQQVSTQVRDEVGWHSAGAPMVAIACCIAALVTGLPSATDLLLPGGQPVLGLVALYVSLSVYLSLRALGRSLAAPLRDLPTRVAFVFGVLCVDRGSRALSLGSEARRRVGALWGFAFVLALVAVARLVSLAQSEIIAELATLACWCGVVVAVADLCPFGATLGHALLSSGYGEQVARDGWRYMRQQLLRRAFSWEFFDGERRLLFYACWLMLWSVALLQVSRRIGTSSAEGLIGLAVERQYPPAVMAAIAMPAMLVAFAVLSLLGGGLALVVSSLPTRRRAAKAGDFRPGETQVTLGLLRQLPLLRRFSEQQLSTIAGRARCLRFGRRTVLVTEGEEARELFVLLKGRAEVLRQQGSRLAQRIATLHAGDVFGQAALLVEGRRNATVRALRRGVAVVIDRRTFAEVATGQQLSQTAELISAAQTLRESTLFEDVDLVTLLEVLDRSERLSQPQGGVVMRRGEAGDALYIVLRGRVKVLGADDCCIAQLSVGKLFGELALLRGQPRNATVVCEEDSELLRVHRDAFFEVMTRHLALGEGLERLASRRLSPQKYGCDG